MFWVSLSSCPLAFSFFFPIFISFVFSAAVQFGCSSCLPFASNCLSLAIVHRIPACQMNEKPKQIVLLSFFCASALLFVLAKNLRSFLILPRLPRCDFRVGDFRDPPIFTFILIHFVSFDRCSRCKKHLKDSPVQVSNLCSHFVPTHGYTFTP